MSKRTQFVVAVLSMSLSAIALPAFAQDAGRTHHGHHRGHGRFSPARMERHLERLTERLSLDEHQVTLVREIMAAARTEAEALRELPRGEARRDAGHALFESVAERIDAILTDTQRTSFAALRAEMRARHEERRARREARGSAPEGI